MKIITLDRKIGNRILYNLKVASSIQWKQTNPVLENGVLGYETDTNILKVGNGYADWINLPIAETVHIRTDVPDDENVYVRLNNEWCVFDPENSVVTYSCTCISEQEPLPELTSEWEVQTLTHKVNSSSIINNLIYLPTINKLVLSSYDQTSSLLYSQDGLEWIEFTPKDNKVNNGYIGNIHYIPEMNIVVGYNFSTMPEFSLYNPISGAKVLTQRYYTQCLKYNNMQYYPVNIAYINNNLYILTDQNLVLRFDFNMEDFTPINILANLNSLFYTKSKTTWSGIYRSVSADFQSNMAHCDYSDLSTFNSVQTSYLKRRNLMVQVDDVIYCYTKYNSTYYLVALNDLANDYIIKVYNIPTEIADKSKVYKFGYLEDIKIFYLIDYSGIYFSKDLTNWITKALPSGIYPGKDLYNNQCTWVNLVYANHLNSVIFTSSTYCGRLNISDIL